jgi:hypothetical protein
MRSWNQLTVFLVQQVPVGWARVESPNRFKINLCFGKKPYFLHILQHKMLEESPICYHQKREKYFFLVENGEGKKPTKHAIPGPEHGIESLCHFIFVTPEVRAQRARGAPAAPTDSKTLQQEERKKTKKKAIKPRVVLESLDTQRTRTRLLRNWNTQPYCRPSRSMKAQDATSALIRAFGNGNGHWLSYFEPTDFLWSRERFFSRYYNKDKDGKAKRSEKRSGRDFENAKAPIVRHDARGINHRLVIANYQLAHLIYDLDIPFHIKEFRYLAQEDLHDLVKQCQAVLNINTDTEDLSRLDASVGLYLAAMCERYKDYPSGAVRFIGANVPVADKDKKTACFVPQVLYDSQKKSHVLTLLVGSEMAKRENVLFNHMKLVRRCFLDTYDSASAVEVLAVRVHRTCDWDKRFKDLKKDVLRLD